MRQAAAALPERAPASLKARIASRNEASIRVMLITEKSRIAAQDCGSADVLFGL